MIILRKFSLSYIKNYISILMIFLCSNFSYSQNEVDLISSVHEGCSPLLVEFNSSLINNGSYTFFWDFGNGNTSNLENPTAIFNDVGSYTVTLTISGDDGQNVIQKQDYIRVFDKPEIDFTYSDNVTGCVPQNISFTSIESPQDSIDDYLWDFGDGNLSTEFNPTHEYTNPGIYNVLLIATSKHGCSSRISYENLVRVQNPTAIFDVMERKSCSGELDAKFFNQSYGMGTLQYEWDFGNNEYSTTKDPSLVFTDVGTYDVKLRVIDDLGCVDSIIRHNFIDVSETKALFAIEKDTVCINEEVVFQNQSVNNRKNYWDFGDGSIAESINGYHKYSTSGLYKVRLTVENYDCEDVVEKEIYVQDMSVDFYLSSDYACNVPVAIKYVPSINDFESYEWHFGNGNIVTDKSPTNTYVLTKALETNQKVTYSDTLYVRSKYGCENKVVKSNVFEINLPQIEIISDKSSSGCKPLDLTFDKKIVYNTNKDEIKNQYWEVNGQQYSAEETMHRVFSEVGNYEIILHTETNLGCTAVAKETVSVGEPQFVDFSISEKEYCGEEFVVFEDFTVGNSAIDNRIWAFGDGESSVFGESFHQYVDTGYMDVKLSVYNNGCMSSLQKNDFIYIKGPILKVTREDICEEHSKAKFQLELKGVDSYVFDFGDGTSIESSESHISHTYVNNGGYEITVSSSNNGCTFNYENLIQIINPVSLFDTIQSKPCVNTEIFLSAHNSLNVSPFLYNDEIKTFLWNFGDETDLLFTDEITVSHQYKEQGTYQIALMVKDVNGCTDTLKRNIEFFKPLPYFSSNYIEGCMPVKFHFFDESESLNPIYKWEWSFGDGSTSIEQNPQHEFNNFGEFNISLTIEDSKGCKSVNLMNKAIEAIEPNADFESTKNYICINDSIRFYDISNSNIESFNWDFGNGYTSSERNPSQLYMDEGNYDVSLHIVDDHGCTTTTEKKLFINVQKPPNPDFNNSLTESNCYPFLVNFFDASESDNLGSYQWYFGDNFSGSALKNPQHIYNKPGNYDVTLISYTTNGCADTIVKENLIDIKGPYAEILVKDSVCVHDSILFSLDNSKNLSTVLWDFGDGSFSNDTILMHKYSSKRDYYITLLLNSDQSGLCNKVFIDTVSVSGLTADFSFIDDQNKGCVPFKPSVINNSKYASSYLWYTDSGQQSYDFSPVFNFNNAGEEILHLVANNDLGCKDTVSYNITIFPLPIVTLSKDTVICKGDEAYLLAEGGISYLWNNESTLDFNDIDNPVARPDQSTQYKVLVNDINNCSSADSLTVVVQQPPVVSLNDTILIIGEHLDLDISDPAISKFVWSPENELSCKSCSKLTFSPLETTKYTVSVTDTSNCFTYDYDFNIGVEKKYSVDVPSAFTPNNDNLNDIIKVEGWGIEQLVYFRVFNISGTLLFESNNIDIGWDGTFKGSPQPIGIYNYVVKVKSFNSDFLYKKGSINLIR